MRICSEEEEEEEEFCHLFGLSSCLLMGITKFRGAIDTEHVRHVVGEEEAIWVLKFVLPYLNEFLLKLRALFCGDPATTMKVIFLFLEKKKIVHNFKNVRR